MSKRLSTLKTVLWGFVGVLVSVSVIRFLHGLGAVTNLSDAAPWGLWIGFDVMSVSYTHLTLPTTWSRCRSRWSPCH